MAQPNKVGKRLAWAAVRRARRWTREQGEWVISQWRGSGLSMRRFAAQHEVDPQRVSFWRKRSDPKLSLERANRARPEVVEVKLAATAGSVDTERMDIELVSGRRLRVAERIDVDVLERVVAALER